MALSDHAVSAAASTVMGYNDKAADAATF